MAANSWAAGDFLEREWWGAGIMCMDELNVKSAAG
jgi:hypothetical protein